MTYLAMSDPREQILDRMGVTEASELADRDAHVEAVQYLVHVHTPIVVPVDIIDQNPPQLAIAKVAKGHSIGDAAL